MIHDQSAENIDSHYYEAFNEYEQDKVEPDVELSRLGRRRNRFKSLFMTKEVVQNEQLNNGTAQADCDLKPSSQQEQTAKFNLNYMRGIQEGKRKNTVYPEKYKN